jgi:hypothetical protein
VRGTFQALQSQQETTAALWPSLNNLRTFDKRQTENLTQIFFPEDELSQGAARQPLYKMGSTRQRILPGCILFNIFDLCSHRNMAPRWEFCPRHQPGFEFHLRPPLASWRQIPAIPNYQCFSGSKYILLGSQLSSLNQIKEDVAWKIIVNRCIFQRQRGKLRLTHAQLNLKLTLMFKAP